jgi:hypothetical protein
MAVCSEYRRVPRPLGLAGVGPLLRDIYEPPAIAVGRLLLAPSYRLDQHRLRGRGSCRRKIIGARLELADYGLKCSAKLSSLIS